MLAHDGGGRAGAIVGRVGGGGCRGELLLLNKEERLNNTHLIKVKDVGTKSQL